MSQSREEPVLYTSLLSEEGEEFLEGNISASDYIDRSRLLAERQARHELLAEVSRARRRLIQAILLIAGVAYVIVSILLGSNGQLSSALAALAVGLIAASSAGISFSYMRRR